MVDWKSAARNFFLREGELQRSDWSWQYIALLVVAGFAGWLLLPLFPNYGLIVGGLVLSGFSLLLIYVKKKRGKELSPVELLVVGILLFFTWWYVSESRVVAFVVLAVIVTSFGFPTFASYMTIFFGVFVVALLGLGLISRATGGEYVSVLALIAVVVLLFLPVGFLSSIQGKRFAEEKTHNGEKLLAVVLSCLLLVFFFLTSLPWVEVGSPLSNSAVLLKTALKSIPVEVGKFSKDIKRSYEREIALAKGDFSDAQVERSVVGLELSDLSPSERRLLEGQSVAFSARLEAEKVERPVFVKASCEDLPGARIVGPCVSKGGECSFSVEGSDSFSLDCVLDSPEVGTHNVALNAVFDFESSVDLTAYVMERKKLREMVRRNLDPLEKFDVRSSSVIKAGDPVRVGVAVDSQPVSVDLESGVGPTIAVTVDNDWDGELNKIYDVVVFVPRGLMSEQVVGTRVAGSPKELSCSELRVVWPSEAVLCDDKLHKVYHIVPEGGGVFDDAVSFRLYTKLDPSVRLMDFFGPTPVTVRNVHVAARYEYQLRREKVFTVEERETV